MLPVNSQPPYGQLRAPRFKVQVNGAPVAGFLDFEVTNNSHFTADTFVLRAALRQLPADFGAGYWSQATSVNVEIFADDTGQGNFASLIYGQVDDVEVDLVQGLLVLSGRDLSAQFLDAKTTEMFQNQTSSEIAQTLAARHGLQAVVQATSTKAGRYYEIDHARMTAEQSEWDLLTYLAQEEGYDVWVSGQALHFEPPPALTSQPYLLVWSDVPGQVREGNFLRLAMRRSLTLAKDVIIKVATWNQNDEKAHIVSYKVSQSYTSQYKKSLAYVGQREGGTAQVYSFTMPNLTPEKALKWAQQKAEEITRHERVLSVEMPGDNLLTSRSVVQLVGTATSWDQTYRCDTVERRMSFNGGYTMKARLKNHSPQSTVVL